MRAKRVVALLIAAMAAYMVLIGYRGATLLREPAITLKVLGVTVFVLPVIGVVLVLQEVRFGLATQRLGERLDAEGVPPEPPAATTTGGRTDRAAADLVFARRRAEVEATPADWRGWYRLAVAYDDAGDRKRARAAMRTAIARAEPGRPAR